MIAPEKNSERNPGEEKRQCGHQVQAGQSNQHTDRHTGVRGALLKGLIKRLMKKGQNLETNMRLPAKQNKHRKEERDTQPEEDGTAGGQKARIAPLEPPGSQLHGECGNPKAEEGQRDRHGSKVVPHQHRENPGQDQLVHQGRKAEEENSPAHRTICGLVDHRATVFLQNDSNFLTPVRIRSFKTQSHKENLRSLLV